MKAKLTRWLWLAILTMTLSPVFFSASSSSRQDFLSTQDAREPGEVLQHLLEQQARAETSGRHADVAAVDQKILGVLLGWLESLQRCRNDSKDTSESAQTVGGSDNSNVIGCRTPVAQTRGRAEQNLASQEDIVRQLLGSSYASLGTALAHMKQLPAAMQAYRSAATYWPQTPGLDRNWGLASMQTEHYEDAVAPLKRALQTNPNDVAVRRGLGLSLSKLDRQQEVVDTLKPIAGQLTRTPTLAYVYSVALLSINDKQQAAGILKVLSKGPLPTTLAFVIGQQLVLLKEDEYALRALHLAEGTGAPSRIYFYEAMVTLRLNQPSKAIPLLEKGLKANPTDVEDEYDLAFTQLQLSDRTDAVVHLRHVLKVKPDHSQANYELGKVLLEEGKTDEAIPFLCAAERASPDQAFIHYQLQIAYRKAGRVEDAKRELQIYDTLKAMPTDQHIVSPSTVQPE